MPGKRRLPAAEAGHPSAVNLGENEPERKKYRTRSQARVDDQAPKEDASQPIAAVEENEPERKRYRTRAQARLDRQECAARDADEEEQLSSKELRINDLSDDAFFALLRYVSLIDRIHCELVCKRWRAVLLKSWDKVKVLEMSQFLTRKSLGFVRPVETFPVFNPRREDFADSAAVAKIIRAVGFRAGDGIRRLSFKNLNGVVRLYRNDLQFLLKQFTNLQHLDLSMMPLTPRCLSKIGQNLKNLETLDLLDVISGHSRLSFRNIPARDTAIMEVCLGDALLSMPSLKVISLAECSSIKGACLKNLNAGVESVNLKECLSVLRESLEAFVKGHGSLVELRLTGVASSKLVNIPQLLVSHCPRIAVLDVRHCGPLFSNNPNDDKWLELIGNVSTLKELYTTLIKDTALISICRGCSDLRVLHVGENRATKNGLRAIRFLQNLEVLNLAKSSVAALDDGVLCELISSAGKKLKALNLSSCPAIHDASLATIGATCRELELLEIGNGSRHITKGGLANLILHLFDEERGLSADRKLVVLALETSLSKTALRGLSEKQLERVIVVKQRADVATFGIDRCAMFLKLFPDGKIPIHGYRFFPYGLRFDDNASEDSETDDSFSTDDLDESSSSISSLEDEDVLQFIENVAIEGDQ